MISESLLAEALGLVEAHHDEREDELVTRLRTAFPGVHFSVCNDNDMPLRALPVIESSYCRLYYVDSSAHCLQLTTDADSATGLAVGLIDQE